MVRKFHSGRREKDFFFRALNYAAPQKLSPYFGSAYGHAVLDKSSFLLEKGTGTKVPVENIFSLGRASGV
jgi:hypothetical protein